MKGRWLSSWWVAVLACAGAPPAALPERPVAHRFDALDGATFNLGSLRGAPVLVHVMTTWSSPALLEVPLLDELHRTGRFEVLAVALDRESEVVSIFVETFGVSYPVVLPRDPADFVSDDGPFGPIGVTPTSVVLDPRGRIVARNDGTWDPAELNRIVEVYGAR